MGNDIRRDEPTEGLERLRHALMNRLTVVVGYAQMIAARPDLDTETRSRADRILSQAQECVRIIESWKQRLPGPERPAPVNDGPAQAVGVRGGPASVRPGPEEAAATGLRSGRVLVVDDEIIIRTLARHVLASSHDVETCETAEEALRLILVGDFDAVLIDLNLGGPTGGRGLYETLRVQHPEVADRVVFMSGGVVGADEVRFLEESGRPYIQKPFNIDELRSLVQRTISF